MGVLHFVTLSYAFCYAISFAIFCVTWKKEFGVVLYKDVVFFMFLSLLGPASLIASFVVLGVKAFGNSHIGDKTFW